MALLLDMDTVLQLDNMVQQSFDKDTGSLLYKYKNLSKGKMRMIGYR